MKRCPKCHRVETDEALKFCRVDGTTLVNDSSSIDQEAGTVRLGSGNVSSEVVTGELQQTSDANINRATAATTVLSPQPAAATTDFSIPIKRRLSPKGVAVIVTAIAAVVTAVVVISYRTLSSRSAIQSIAVMPFVNASGNADLDYLSDGMTETLISGLSQIAGVNVKARSSVFRYKGKETDARTIGKELGVQAVLNGRLVQRGDQLTLSLELIDAENENLIWQDKYDRRQADLVKLQSEIARDVSSQLKLKLTSADQLRLAKNYTSDPEVYRLYLQGRYYWNKRTRSEVDKGVTFFQQAIAKDPKFALGYAGLADSHEDIGRPQKLEYIRRALEIDPDLAEAHASLGYQLMCKQDWIASERELTRAKELNPNYAQAYAWNGMRLTMIGKYNEALAELDRALAIEPTANGINFYKAITLATSGRRDAAINLFKRIQEMDPTFSWAYSNLARQYFFDGNIASAVEQWSRSVELEGNADGARRLREAFASGGWAAFIAEAKDGRFGGFASIEGPTNAVEKEKMLIDLQRRVEDGGFWVFLIRTDRTYDSLRGDPRFQEILKRFDPPQ